MALPFGYSSRNSMQAYTATINTSISQCREISGDPYLGKPSCGRTGIPSVDAMTTHQHSDVARTRGHPEHTLGDQGVLRTASGSLFVEPSGCRGVSTLLERVAVEFAAPLTRRRSERVHQQTG